MEKTSPVDSRLIAAFDHLKSGRQDAACSAFQALLDVSPGNAIAVQMLGNIAYSVGEPLKAVAYFRRALELDPSQTDVWCNLATAEFQADRFAEGFHAIDCALALSSDNARVYAIRGSAYARQKRDVEALNDFAVALRLNPLDGLSAVSYWACACRICWWTQAETVSPRVRQLVDQGAPLVPPFSLLSVMDEPRLHRTCAVNRARKFTPPHALPLRVCPNSDTRFKVAYLSADFHEHATTHLMAGVFEHHNNELIETIAVSIGPVTADAVRLRVVKAFSQFVDAHSWSDTAIAHWLIDRGVHILVDLKGHTEFARPGIVALKPAPLVVSYLGYPGTSGMPAVDYIIGDSVVTPFHHQAHFSESIVQLPNCYQCNDKSRVLPEQSHSRDVEGLPADALVFAAFNHPYKIRPDMFDAWCRILKSLPNSVLWVLCDQRQTQTFLLNHAAEQGVTADRIVFAKRVGYKEHLARHVLADLFLDTWPYCAHTTASDALWMGLPVLTLKGQSFASRVAASLLKCVGLPDLVVDSLSAYEEKAVELGRNPTSLQKLKLHLESIRFVTPLFDTAGFAKHLESAYIHMIKRWQSGALPVPFAIKGDGSVVEAADFFPPSL
ncbi:MAG TPA: tetratricopeptide repeat protein [Burkholderiaceae bacterium]|nr:tetratricopeptide repeat protein [Burkholderiaceae bacterium]